MEKNFIIINDYINYSDIEPQFIALLEENDLIHVYEVENERFLHSDELSDIEKYARMYYDLSINIEGIDVIHNLLDRINEMQEEMTVLRRRLLFLE